MQISVSQVQTPASVTVLQPHGDVDGSNYRELIAQGEAAKASGARYILIDLSDVPYMSSAGLVALHAIANLLRGTPQPDFDAGWAALHAMANDAEQGEQCCLKLCNPQADVERVITMAGLKRFYEIYPDQTTALASF